MKKLLLLLLLIPLVSIGQTQPIKVQVTQQPTFAQSFNSGLQAGAAAKNARAASANAATAASNARSEALKNNSETIQIDLLKGNSGIYKNVVIKKISGWMVTANFLTIKDEINNAKIYKVVSLNDLRMYMDKYDNVATYERKNKKLIAKISERNLYEPIFPPKFLNDSETLFLEWSREAISDYDRLTRLVLKKSAGETVYKAEYKNKGYSEMLRPLISDYNFGKQDAKNKLMELKEYLDLGIITQDEFDEKAVSLKKILLGN